MSGDIKNICQMHERPQRRGIFQMISVLFVFILSIFICCAIAYILGLFWFSDMRNRRFRSFFLLGIELFIWTLLNAVTMISHYEYFPVIYTLRMAMVCVIPFGVTWFILDFIDSSLKKNMWVRNLFILLPAVDILCMATNPLHYKYFTDYVFPVPARAPLFWIHTAMDFLLIIIVFILLIRYIIRFANKNPMLILTVVGMLIPYTINILYSFGKMPFAHDVTPVGFFITFILFVFVAYHSRLLNFKTSLFSTTMDSLDELIIISNNKRYIVDINKRALEIFPNFSVNLGRTRAGDFYNHLKTNITEMNPENLIDEMRQGIDIDGEFTINLPENQKRTYRLGRRTIYERGRNTGNILVLSDVSSYHEMIRELNDLSVKATTASRAKSDFLANMSHEIRTPMNAIIGMTNIGKSSADMDRAAYCFSKIEDASKHLLGIINDILDMSKIESGKFELAPVEFNFEKMLQRAVSVVNFRVEEKKQKLTVYIDKNIPQFLIGDEQRLVQVITNLLGNAVKFTPEEGIIGINTYLLGEENGVCTIKISVRDTGIGISPEHQAKLFQSFQQAENDTSRKFGGTGLGLAISKSIVEMMGGEIGLESEIGKGSRFTFTVQVKRGEKEKDQQMFPKYAIDCDSIRVLIIDDDKHILEDFKGIVNGLGVSCDVAESAKDALLLVDQGGSYDLYFVDWKMPDVNGFELTMALREKARTPHESPVIMISSAEISEIAIEAQAAGIDKILQKPLFPSTILDIINNCLGLSPATEELKKTKLDIKDIFRGCRILLAEDMEINREIAQALLEPTGLELDFAINGAEAVRMFGESPDKYDMIFMDVQMPEMDGYEATRRIRALDIPKAKTIPIIAMTANVFREDVEKCLESGMNGHIGKPIDMETLFEKLHEYLTRD